MVYFFLFYFRDQIDTNHVSEKTSSAAVVREAAPRIDQRQRVINLAIDPLRWVGRRGRPQTVKPRFLPFLLYKEARSKDETNSYAMFKEMQWRNWWHVGPAARCSCRIHPQPSSWKHIMWRFLIFFFFRSKKRPLLEVRDEKFANTSVPDWGMRIENLNAIRFVPPWKFVYILFLFFWKWKLRSFYFRHPVDHFENSLSVSDNSNPNVNCWL